MNATSGHFGVCTDPTAQTFTTARKFADRIFSAKEMYFANDSREPENGTGPLRKTNYVRAALAFERAIEFFALMVRDHRFH